MSEIEDTLQAVRESIKQSWSDLSTYVEVPVTSVPTFFPAIFVKGMKTYEREIDNDSNY